MKAQHTFYCLVFMLVTLSSSKAQIPNAGFENWKEVTKYEVTYHEVIGWNTPNALNVFSGEDEMAEQTTDAHSGSSALKLTNLANRNNLPAFASAVSPLQDDDFIEKFPVSGKITALNGYYKYNFIGDHDSCSISVLLYRNGITVAAGQFFGSTKRTSFESFSVPVEYFMDSLPDSATINIFVSANNAQQGSVLIVDDLSFTTPSTGVDQQPGQEITASVYPNPVYGMAGISFEQKQPGTTTINVYNILGTKIQSLITNEKFSAGIHHVDWETEGLPEGMYFVKIIQQSVEKTIKVLLK
jgi:hypothetical protein